MKVMLEIYGFEVADQTEYNWIFHKKEAKNPVIIVPRKGNLLGLDVQENIISQTNMDDATFLRLRDAVQSKDKQGAPVTDLKT